MAPTSVVPPPQISTSTTSPPPPHSPQSTSPTSTRARIRAFGYLRGHHHSTPTPAPPPPPENQPTGMNTIRQVSSSAGSTEEHQHHHSSTTSWLPTVGGISGLVRVASASSANGVATATTTTTEHHLHNPLSFHNHSNSTPLQGHDAGPEPVAATNNAANGTSNANGSTQQAASNGLPEGKIPTIRFVPHVDPRSTRRPHTFAPMERAIKQTGEVVKVGRFSDRDNGNPVGFKSKVVSRRHCEFWWHEGSWYMKDVGSSSGTFLNHVRLSHPNTESKPFVVHDGDVVQLGIDFKGGEELIFRCVKMKLELNRDAKSINQFNVATHKKIQNLGKPSVNKAGGSDAHAGECAICLLNIAPCQSLFVAPCSHVWHFKCIKPIIDSSYPILPCPNCREIADLEAEIEDGDDDSWENLDKVKEESANEASANEAANKSSDESSKPTSVDAAGEDRASTPEAAEAAEAPEPTEAENVAPNVGTPPMHIPLSNLNLSVANGHTDGIPDPSNQTPRNNAGPFVLNGTTGRM
ncbi:hypothetical protein ABW19_dt0204981 [Dactylella cylindrospora]|nr:hypothetical protein ABW19_dt0204981 [Dactylella cylindrospora]